jgi:hypothetical protein
MHAACCAAQNTQFVCSSQELTQSTGQQSVTGCVRVQICSAWQQSRIAFCLAVCLFLIWLHRSVSAPRSSLPKVAKLLGREPEAIKNRFHCK